MGDELDRYVLYLNRAVALRMAADGDKSPLSRSALLALAIDYEQLADVLEHLIRSNNQDTGDLGGDNARRAAQFARNEFPARTRQRIVRKRSSN